MKIYLDTVGCRLNQSEIETYARQFHAAGHTLVSEAQTADLVVINTCAVTAAAASDSRQKIRWARRVGKAEIVVTGCWASLEPRAAAALPGVRWVIPNQEKEHLVAQVLDLPEEAFELEPLVRQPVPGARLRTRAFIKVQDGCDNHCTFCVTTLARGEGRSRSVNEVLKDVRAALKGSNDPSGVADGAQEIVLTGVHLGSWGKDLTPAQRLPDLIKAILQETDLPRLRLSSLEPWDLEAEFFALWEDKRLCRHLHLPLQSGCAATLRRMARKTTPRSFAALVEAARQAIPGVAITTDLIVGFPGESEAEFAESLAFVDAMRFAGGHVFPYSARPGTAAARMPAQVPHALRQERSVQARRILTESARAFQSSFLDQVLPVLWESAIALSPSGWEVSGLSDNYIRVKAHAPRQLWNQVTPVRLVALDTDGIRGQIQTEPTQGVI